MMILRMLSIVATLLFLGARVADGEPAPAVVQIGPWYLEPQPFADAVAQPLADRLGVGREEVLRALQIVPADSRQSGGISLPADWKDAIEAIQADPAFVEKVSGGKRVLRAFDCAQLLSEGIPEKREIAEDTQTLMANILFRRMGRRQGFRDIRGFCSSSDVILLVDTQKNVQRMQDLFDAMRQAGHGESFNACLVREAGADQVLPWVREQLPESEGYRISLLPENALLVTPRSEKARAALLSAGSPPAGESPRPPDAQGIWGEDLADPESFVERLRADFSGELVGFRVRKDARGIGFACDPAEVERVRHRVEELAKQP